MAVGESPYPHPNTFQLRVRAWLQRLFHSNFARNVAATYASQIHLMVCNFAASILIARALAPAGRGIFVLAVNVVVLGVQFGSLGLQSSMTLLAAKYPLQVARLLGNATIVTLLAGVLSAAAWPLILPFWPASGWLLGLALVNIPLNLGYMLLQNILIGINAVGKRNLQEVVGNLLRLALVIWLWCVGTTGVEVYFAAGLVIPAIGIGFSIVHFRSHIQNDPWPSWPLARQALQYGCKAHLVATMAFLATRQFDFFAVNWFLGAAEAGRYSIAQQLALTMALFPQVVGVLLFARFCRSNRWTERIRMARIVVIVMTCVMLPATIAAAVLARPFIVLCFGNDFAAAAEPFRWMLLGVFIWSIEVQARLLLQSDDVRPAVMLGWIGTACVSVLFNLLLVPTFGMTGGAIATTATYGCMGLLTFLQMRRELRVQRETGLDSAKDGAIASASAPEKNRAA